jgi:hypothetical protein
MAGPYLNQGSFKTRITDVDTTPQEELGIWRFEAGKVLRYVKAGALIPQYEAVMFDESATASPGLFGNQVIQSIGESHMLLGVADQATMASLSYGWITVYGQATARVVTATVPGNSLGVGTLTGVLARVQTSTFFMPRLIAVQTGLSAGSAVFIAVL